MSRGTLGGLRYPSCVREEPERFPLEISGGITLSRRALFPPVPPTPFLASRELDGVTPGWRGVTGGLLR